LETCPGEFYAATEDELLLHMDKHARVAHQQDPTTWPADTSAFVKGLIRTDRAGPTIVALPIA
jgi:hypothetical protein